MIIASLLKVDKRVWLEEKKYLLGKLSSASLVMVKKLRNSQWPKYSKQEIGAVVITATKPSCLPKEWAAFTPFLLSFTQFQILKKNPQVAVVPWMVTLQPASSMIKETGCRKAIVTIAAPIFLPQQVKCPAYWVWPWLLSCIEKIQTCINLISFLTKEMKSPLEPSEMHRLPKEFSGKSWTPHV